MHDVSNLQAFTHHKQLHLKTPATLPLAPAWTERLILLLASRQQAYMLYLPLPVYMPNPPFHLVPLKTDGSISARTLATSCPMAPLHAQCSHARYLHLVPGPVRLTLAAPCPTRPSVCHAVPRPVYMSVARSRLSAQTGRPLDYLVPGPVCRTLATSRPTTAAAAHRTFTPHLLPKRCLLPKRRLHAALKHVG